MERRVGAVNTFVFFLFVVVGEPSGILSNVYASVVRS